MMSNLPTPEMYMWRVRARATIDLAWSSHPSKDLVESLKDLRDLVEEEIQVQIERKAQKS